MHRKELKNSSMDELLKKRIERMLLGDEAAFDAVYRHYTGRLYRTAFLILGNSGDSEDAVQEAFVKCWLCRGELKVPEAFEGWLMKILVRTAAKLLRKRRGTEVSLEQMLSEEADGGYAERVLLDTRGTEPLAKVISEERSRIIQNALLRVPEKQRLVLVLYYYESYSTKEIAGALGIFEGTVKSRLHKGRKRMKELLSESGLRSNRTQEAKEEKQTDGAAEENEKRKQRIQKEAADERLA